ncbi:MAG: hypothetical protein Q7S32_03720 [bacterium]|nr:hypothetical protein [bacterium]
MTTTRGGEMNERVSLDKFHSLFGRALSVALEGTFYPDPKAGPIEIPEEYAKLSYAEPVRGQVRFYYPAVASGDVRSKEEGVITFLPWFDRSLAAYHRIQLRVRPFQRGSRLMPRIMFARLGEEKAFTPEVKPGAEQTYLQLDFFSMREEMFLDLYVRVEDEKGPAYFVIEADPKENTPEKVTLRVRRIDIKDAPTHLINLPVAA